MAKKGVLMSSATRSLAHAIRAVSMASLAAMLLLPWAARGATSVDDLISAAEEAFAGRHLEDTMFAAIARYEAVLPHLPGLPVQSQAFVLNRLAQLCYEASTFETGFRSSERDWLEAGKAYGFRSLRLCPGFAEWEEKDFARAVSQVIDPAALLWTADSWGVLCGLSPIQGMLFIGRVKLLFERCLEVDPTYWGGSPHNALGALMVVTPPTLGGDREAGRRHLERALEIDPTFLQNHVVYAEYWGFTYDGMGRVSGVRDADLVRAQLAVVLDEPIGGWPFWNREAKREAAALLQRLEEMTE
ncbi:MAG: hypothetical protein JSW65_05130 [Candidatus Bipolaricaulota bacterium]|nr:MAG: hypothetical protein JSW65_05130 [Candidatus Bipolaricaulota bacterium]